MNLCDNSDAFILFNGTRSTKTQARNNPINEYKNVLFKNSALFTDCISEINNSQIDNAKDIDVIMPMHNLIEYSGNYLKT